MKINERVERIKELEKAIEQTKEIASVLSCPTDRETELGHVKELIEERNRVEDSPTILILEPPTVVESRAKLQCEECGCIFWACLDNVKLLRCHGCPGEERVSNICAEYSKRKIKEERK